MRQRQYEVLEWAARILGIMIAMQGARMRLRRSRASAGMPIAASSARLVHLLQPRRICVAETTVQRTVDFHLEFMWNIVPSLRHGSASAQSLCARMDVQTDALLAFRPHLPRRLGVRAPWGHTLGCAGNVCRHIATMACCAGGCSTP